MAVVVPIISTFDAKGVTKAIADFKKLDGAGQRTQFALGTLNKGLGSATKTLAKYGSIAAGVLGGIGLGLAVAGERAATSNARIAQVNESMGLFGTQVGVVNKRLVEYAEATARATGIDQNTIKMAQAKLLTFKNLAVTAGQVGGAFDRATMAALDLQSTGFGDAATVAVQLGKALQDPIKGITALRRSGITFTDAEKAKIKVLVESGKMLEAQDTLLKAVESQVQGTSLATANATDKMKVAFSQVSENLGTLLLPLVERLQGFVADKVVPWFNRLRDAAGENGVGGAMQFLSGEFFKATGNMGAFGNIVLTITAAMVALRLVMLAATIAQVAFNVALFSNPIGIVVAAVIVFVTALAALAIKFEFVRDVFKKVWNTIIGYFQMQINIALGIYEFFINRFIDGVNLIIKGWNKIPFTPKIKEIEKVNLALDITALKVGNAGKAAQTSAAQFRMMESGTAQVAKSLTGSGSGTGSSGGVAKATETAAEKFKKFADSAKTVVADQKNLRDALKNTATAQKNLQTATDKVAAAQAHLNQVASGYGAGSAEAKSAQEDLNKANRDATQAGFDLTKAQYAVGDAEKALEQARRRNNPREITEAEIALSEANFALEDAQKAVTDATDAVTAAQTKLNETINGASTDSDTYKSALQLLKDAQDEQVEAIDNVRSAKERELEVTRNLAKAEILLRKAKGKLTKKQKAEADKLLADLNTPVTVTVPTPSGGSAPVSSGGFDFSGIDFSGFSVGGLATLADGGIVTKPTLSLIGEGGQPEAVIPLSKMGAMGGDTIINVTVTSADPNAVVDALRRYQRQNGALPLRVTG